SEALPNVDVNFGVSQGDRLQNLDVTGGTLDQPLELGVSSVLKTDDLSHWALTHTGNEPDFHRRDSFRLMV
ncbi:MAG: hypothetical protein AAF243_17370, partial [Cyanobacteria bacterium P01_A01_bin.137]